MVGEHEFRDLINSMKDRCQAVINADGLFTKYQKQCISLKDVSSTSCRTLHSYYYTRLDGSD